MENKYGLLGAMYCCLVMGNGWELMSYFFNRDPLLPWVWQVACSKEKRREFVCGYYQDELSFLPYERTPLLTPFLVCMLGWGHAFNQQKMGGHTFNTLLAMKI